MKGLRIFHVQNIFRLDLSLTIIFFKSIQVDFEIKLNALKFWVMGGERDVNNITPLK